MLALRTLIERTAQNEDAYNGRKRWQDAEVAERDIAQTFLSVVRTMWLSRAK